MIIVVTWQVSNSDTAATSITHSLSHPLTSSHYLLPSHSLSLYLNLCSDSVSLSLWHTLVEVTTSDSPSDDHCCPMSGKPVRGSCYSDAAALRCWWRDDDDRCFSSHSLNHSLALSPFISPSITLFLNLCSDSVLFSLWHALVEITTSDSPSDDHCCPMTGKQFWCCCYSDADDVMMMIDVFHLTHSITHSLSHPFTHCCSSHGLLGCDTSSIRVHWSRIQHSSLSNLKRHRSALLLLVVHSDCCMRDLIKLKLTAW